MTYFCPALDPPLGGSGRKTTTLVRDLEYFIHTKFHPNLSSGSGEEVKNVNCLTDDGRQTDDRRRTTDDRQRVITIGHWSLSLLCPKKEEIFRTQSYDKRPYTNKCQTGKVTIQKGHQKVRLHSECGPTYDTQLE